MTALLLGALATGPPPVSQGQVILILAAGVALGALYYGGACWLWPFARCWWCENGRRYQSEKRKTWRPCRWCKGSGRRLRIGRWIFNYVRGKQRGAM